MTADALYLCSAELVFINEQGRQAKCDHAEQFLRVLLAKRMRPK